ncbi:MAG: BLUF domain-containing protein [Rubrivivax sp.]|nr:BLUF domain-containing protein [Rubrivivax sp.]
MNHPSLTAGGLACCAYRSKQAEHMTRADLASMLRECQMRNINRHVTGLLLRIDDRFLQYLEGPPDAVLALWTNVLGDPRHSDVECLFRGPCESRLFTHWSMAFSDLSSPSLRLGPTNEMLQQVLAMPVPADERGQSDDIFHRFWAECAVSLPR